MKYLAIISMIGGVLAILLAIFVVLSHHRLLGISGAGYLRGASSLLLLALALMVYKRVYQSK